MTTDFAQSRALLSLRETMKGQTLLPSDPGYHQARQVWNGAVDRYPAALAMCETVEDVRAAVRAAGTNRMALSVRGGGHDWAGRALCDGGIVVDLTKLRDVQVDPVARIATIGGGATAGDLITAAAPHGLAAVTGNVGAVGMAGFLLAGGYGPLTTRFGLAIDNLLGAEVVLANGEVVTVDAEHNSDLFWAFRGGGGNFGVLTSMRLRLHPVDEVLAGIILFPWSQAESVLGGYAAVMASAAEELSVLAGLLPTAEGHPLVFLGPIWTGEPSEGRHIIERLERLGIPVHADVRPISYRDLIGLYDAQVISGRHYALKTRWLPDLTPEILSAVAAAGGARTSPHSFIAFHHFHGPGTRIDPSSTVFALRRDHFMMEVVAAWDPILGADCAHHHQWVFDLFTALAPHALPGGYPNFLTTDDVEQIGSAYGANASRLR